MTHIIYSDYLVVGSGIAGLWFAYRVHKKGKTIILTKKEATESNTTYAQGGIAAAVGNDDSTEFHYQDTLKNGHGLSRPEIVRLVCETGPKLVNELYQLGINFATCSNSSGQKQYDLGKEGGHSRARIVHAKDYTGKEIEYGLLRLVKNSCEIYEYFLVFDLVITNGKCQGVKAIDTRTGEAYYFLGKVTVLATGGIGQIYLHTTNSVIATGDGIAIAYNNGARIANMEFVQFHPTALYGYKTNNRYFLITESVRGEGAVLKTLDGNTFMEKYHELGSLAPRDVVARAIDSEMKKSGAQYVLLDVTHIDPNRIIMRFPNIYNTCKTVGLDITKEPIPVVPAAHYICGGIEIDRWGQTSIPNLLAIGECAHSGLHGANRLASNSLLEALAFAEQSAKIAGEIRLNNGLDIQHPLLEQLPKFETQNNPEAEDLINELRKIIWDGAGIVRSNERILRALKALKNIFNDTKKLSPHSVSVIELKNMLTVAFLILKSAYLRNESRGLHFKEDYPRRDDENFLKDTVLQKIRESDQEVV
jgi:L-aspartate oxidase